MNGSGASRAPLLHTERPLSGRPVLVSGPASAAILGAEGTFSLPWDTRGALLEWGGVYAQGVRLTGPWSVAVGDAGAEVPLGPSTLRSLTHERWSVESDHTVEGRTVRDTVLPLTDAPGVGRRLEVRGVPGTSVSVSTELPPWLAPVLIEGVRPYEFELRTTRGTVEIRSHGWGLCLHASTTPRDRAIDGIPWDGSVREGAVQRLRARYDLRLDDRGLAGLDWVLLGGLRNLLERETDEGAARLRAAGTWRSAAEAPWTAWAAQVPRLRLPDDPGLEDAYRLAGEALRALYTDPEPGMSGLVAGYPWYAALWFRDIAWMLPAVLWLGDSDRVDAALATAFHYQAPADLSLLGATQGELPMQLSPGPVFLFGTSDTTLYYPGLVLRLVRHTGERDRAARYGGGVRRAIAWARRKVDPRTGLFTHGGEVAALRKATTDAGQVHYGIDAFDTTIWDSADRRDHAIDVQVLYQAALDDAASLEALEGRAADPTLSAEAEGIRGSIRDRYRWPEERYLFDSLRADGTPRRDLRPNALRAVEAGLFSREESIGFLDRAGEDDLSTPWGVRTLSSRAPSYDPLAYHEGQVWTIATAWAAAAELRMGRGDAGVRYLDRIGERIRSEGGYASECYRGDRPDPFDACFLLGFSVAPFLTTIFEGLWGLRARLDAGIVECRPRMPTAWRSASLHGLRLGAGRLDLDYAPGRVTAVWSGPGPLSLVGDAAETVLLPGVPGPLDLPGRSPTS